MNYRILHGDCIEQMRTLPDNSVDAVVTDPPYGLEFMGKEWDKLDGEAWKSGGFSKPGIGERSTPWVSYGSSDTANATCKNCGGRMRGKRKCSCDVPDWRVKDKPIAESKVDSRMAQGRKMQEWHEAWAVEALRVLKPGGHLLSFGGTRTHHRMMCAIEDAGFEIRDCLMWMFGSGFPKSLDVSKAIDKAAGAEREVISEWRTGKAGTLGGKAALGGISGDDVRVVSSPATPDAERWDGWGTALKPAYEPIVLARKPLTERTVAAQVLATGTGALNIGASRIGIDAAERDVIDHRSGGLDKSLPQRIYGEGMGRHRDIGDTFTSHTFGRWPANVILSHHPDCEPIGTRRVKGDARPPQHGTRDGGFYDVGTASSNKPCGPLYGATTVEAWRCVDGCPVALLDAQSGVRPTGVAYKNASGTNAVYGAYAKRATSERSVNGGDTGGASRFFRTFPPDDATRFAYTPKASRRERRGSTHPTVKPVALMRYLVRLITPPGGIVLDPFAGSGTTGEACVLEGFGCILIERESEYIADIRARFAAVQPPLVQVAG